MSAVRLEGLLVDRRLFTPSVRQESRVSLSQDSECLSCRYGQGLELFLPHLAGVVVEDAEVAGGLVRVRVHARAGAAQCPSCRQESARVHSHYVRRLADAAIGGRRMVIMLTVRRLFCDDPGCGKRTFAEQVPGLTVRYAQDSAAARLAAGHRRRAGRAGRCPPGRRLAGPGQPAGAAAAGDGHRGSARGGAAGARGR